MCITDRLEKVKNQSTYFHSEEGLKHCWTFFPFNRDCNTEVPQITQS